MRPSGVVVTGASVLNAVAEDLDAFTDALFAVRGGIRVREGMAGGWLPEFSVAGWAERHLAGDPAAAERLHAATRRAALPARTAACVGLAAVRHAGLTDTDETALIVAGNNLALDYHAEALRRFHERPGSMRPSHALNHLDTDAVGTVSETTGVAGEGWTTGAASASGTVAALLGARLIAAGELDSCLVVAPVAELSAAEFRAFQTSGAMARADGDAEPAELCRPFDRARSGFVYGQGAAAVLLESAEAARRRGAEALAEVAGWGQRLDARRGTAPNAAGQVRALRSALASAGVEPAEVDYVNAHGTGSVAGDPVEAEALAEVFGRTGRTGRTLVNSTKPLTGHCLSAAGLHELIATVLQLRGGFVHGNPCLHDPIDPGLGLLGTSTEKADLRIAVSNSVAFSGINAALVLRSVKP
ncbi:beta-ketoacyl synthase N-terminal-like domain-containing protein [Amycolatopsis nigrescens]|uniref:beta-ketoacyl synthase N-terminal-like domain-containing protein n=1 Tax=Amycolatopsis nigrescens TaxID=381445 RepID=UPI000374CFC7|nr:beta-ketoacyl synthase N-terminal-like domain-containing protein [Amycolatopsis nigrescens]